MYNSISYKAKQCLLCESEFIPVSGAQKYCRTCMPSCSNKVAYNKFYHAKFAERIRIKQAECYERNYEHYRKIYNLSRKKRRKVIQETWGHIGGTNGQWQKAEVIAPKILFLEGFSNPKRLNYFPHSNFDLRANNNGQVCVFQVTMRTHCNDMKRHQELAVDLGLEYFILYIKPDLSGYILKSITEPSVEELKLSDLQRIKSL